MKMLSTVLLVVTICSITALSQAPAKKEFQVCSSTYALCTKAKCSPIKILQTPLLFSCGCDVMTGYSLGKQPCQEKPEETSDGQLIRSRYFPIKTYARCSNNRPWAMCLDSPCIVDKKDKTKAKCTCTVEQGLGDYVVYTENLTESTCTSDYLSSATVDDVDQATDFLATYPELGLAPYDFKVFNVLHK